ncbi:hypothetical protein EV196_108265 [Mariniflexile fucanivorans]|uniref:Uncharacterized protein n=1 Tax=Mariniflexile fucanivorans TaxID=264023 RepID=A0A4R1RDV4_9FLAO|nr:hypothetical protein EV196_108265 [Mariniflexile fucanivorans]
MYLYFFYKVKSILVLNRTSAKGMVFSNKTLSSYNLKKHH